MNLSIRQIHPVFVGEVSGIDITSPLAQEEVAAIEAGMDRHAVLVFRDQQRPASCCATSTSMPPSRTSSMSMPGACGT
jgi:alpha-ketoglutarate-dependent taurine dioxygenase